MLLRTLSRKIRAERRGVAILLVFLLLSTGFNFTLSIIGSVVQNLDSISSQGNTIIFAENASLEEIEKYGEVLDYAYCDLTEMEIGGKNITVFEGYGEFRTMNVKSPGPGKAVVIGMSISAGEKVDVNGDTYTVSKSIYYPFNPPMVLTEHRGKTLYVLMKAKNTEALSKYLERNTKVLQFNTWKGGNAPWKEEIEDMKSFTLSLFGIVIGATLLIIFLLSITHILGELRGVGVMKAIGMPDSFLTFLFTGSYLLLASLGYLIGIVIGTFLGAHYSKNLVSLPFSLNLCFLGMYNLIIYIAIILLALLPFLYVKRVNVVNALRGGFSRISRMKYVVIFALLLFGILTPYTISQQFMNEQADVPFEAMVTGDVSSLNMGEKAGVLYGVKVENLSAQAYFLGYNSSFKSTVIQGRWFSSRGEMVVGYGIAKKYHLRVGDRIRINIIGKWERYRVVGISSSPLNDYKAVYLPKVNYVPDTVVFLREKNDEILKNLEREGYRVYTRDDMVEHYRSSLNLLNTLLSGIFIALLIISILSLFTLLYLDIKKNEKVYASLKAMGIPDSHVYREFLPVLALTSLIGVLVSLPPSLILGTHIYYIILPSIGHQNVIFPVFSFALVIISVFLVISYALLRRIMGRLDVITALRQ